MIDGEELKVVKSVEQPLRLTTSVGVQHEGRLGSSPNALRVFKVWRGGRWGGARGICKHCMLTSAGESLSNAM